MLGITTQSVEPNEKSRFVRVSAGWALTRGHRVLPQPKNVDVDTNMMIRTATSFLYLELKVVGPRWLA